MTVQVCAVCTSQSAELTRMMMVDKVALSNASQGPSEGDGVWTAIELTNDKNSETMLCCTEEKKQKVTLSQPSSEPLPFGRFSFSL